LLAETLAVVLILFAGQIVGLGLGLSPEARTITARGLLVGALPYIGWIILVCCLLTRGSSFAWRLPQSRKEWLKEVAWAIVILAVAELASMAAFAIGWNARVASQPTYWNDALQDHGTRMAFLALAPLSALYQEMLCRVYMQSRLTQILHGHPVIVVALSALLFTAVHAYAPLQSLAVLMVGLVFGTSYQLNRRIPRLVIAHAASLILHGLR
jgi:membrane protease YdiL (CAAX protease family)